MIVMDKKHFDRFQNGTIWINQLTHFGGKLLSVESKQQAVLKEKYRSYFYALRLKITLLIYMDQGHNGLF